MRLTRRSKTAFRLRTFWRRIGQRVRRGAEAFLTSAVPPPGMIFPDSGGPLVQFPTLSSLEIRYEPIAPPAWDERSAAPVDEALRERLSGRIRPHREKSPAGL